ncbi:MAG: DNA polymerase I, partial [Clostridia bacterium]|nr:DNA polymerase I [Clostridia bacterium]
VAHLLGAYAIPAGLRAKLTADKDNAYRSRTLGTSCTEAPIPTDPETYRLRAPQEAVLAAHLARLEMFKLIERLELTPGPVLATAAGEAAAPAAVAIVAPDAIGAAAALGLGEGGAVALSEGKIASLTEEELPAVVAGRTLRVNDAKALYALCPDAAVTFDTSLAAYLLNPSAGGYDVAHLLGAYAIPAVPVASEELAPFASFPLLCDRLTAELRKVDGWELLETVELPLARVLADMEERGFLVDREGIAAFGEELQQRIDFLVGEIYELVGCEFNLNSPKQLGEALFVKLGLPAGKKTKNGYSTSAEVLEDLRDKHPAVELLLEYRQLTKLRSTYCEGLTKAIAPDGRIHTSFNQTETCTGRISSAEPNLQNIPVRTELGSQMRRFFLAPEGRVLCDADYSQIELRVLAHLSGDPAMIEAFRSGADIHAATAAQVFGLPIEMVPPVLRSRAKAVNFGIVYGIGPFSLAKDIGVTFAEAKRYIDSYLGKDSGVAAYMDRVVAQAMERGFVETAFGRRRYLPELTSSNHQLRAFGERVARNAPIQGTAADIIKIAMVRVFARLRRELPDAHLILQIHDELIVEAAEADAERAAAILREEMEGAFAMRVPLPADVHVGKDWYQAKG